MCFYSEIFRKRKEPPVYVVSILTTEEVEECCVRVGNLDSTAIETVRNGETKK
jgi:hypothetical protein